MHFTSTFGKLNPGTTLGWVTLVGGGFHEQFSTVVSSISLWGCQTHKARGKKIFQIQIPKLDTPYWVYRKPVAEFQFKFASIFVNFQFPSKFRWKSNILCFLNWFIGFVHLFEWIRLQIYKISKIHENFSPEPFLVRRWQAEPWVEGLKNQNFQSAPFRTKI